MHVKFEKSFLKDLKKLKSKTIRSKTKEIILQLEAADTLHNIPNLEDIKSAKNHYRVRIQNFRLGFRVSDHTIELVRLLDRKDIYKYFP